MDFSRLIGKFNRLSLPKKVAAGVAAIAGGVALIGIPILSLRPPSPPSVFNEDAYFKKQIGDRGSVGGTVTPNQNAGAIDTTTTPDLPPLSADTATSPLPPDSSSLTRSSTKIDTADTATPDIDIGANSSLNDPAGKDRGTAGGINNPYAGTSGLSRYTSPDSISNNAYRVSTPGSTSLNTPYSLPNSSSGASSTQPFNLQPGAGNSFADLNPFDQNNPGGNTNPNAAIAPGTGGTIPSRSAIAPSNLDGSSGDVAAPTTPNNPKSSESIRSEW